MQVSGLKKPKTLGEAKSRPKGKVRGRASMSLTEESWEVKGGKSGGLAAPGGGIGSPLLNRSILD